MSSMVTDLEHARMREAGYTSPAARDGCRTCVHGRIKVWDATYQMRCGKWKIPVRKLGVCGDWTKEVKT